MNPSNKQAHAPIPATVKGMRTGPLSRREAMQWVMAAVATSQLSNVAFSQPTAAKEEGRNVVSQEQAAKIPDPNGKGYGTDPKLVKSHKPGDFWPLTFDDAQKACATALADTLLPKDKYGPAASEVGVVEMMDEWVSAPYPEQKNDRPMILEGLAWIDAESLKRFKKTFAALTENQRAAILDDICFTETAKSEFRRPAECFSRFRNVCAAAYYATPPGWEAIGYVGNVALEKFDGPPAEVLEKLGVKQTVL